MGACLSAGSSSSQDAVGDAAAAPEAAAAIMATTNGANATSTSDGGAATSTMSSAGIGLVVSGGSGATTVGRVWSMVRGDRDGAPAVVPPRWQHIMCSSVSLPLSCSPRAQEDMVRFSPSSSGWRSSSNNNMGIQVL